VHSLLDALFLENLLCGPGDVFTNGSSIVVAIFDHRDGVFVFLFLSFYFFAKLGAPLMS
jgi:hypothetical protein